MVHEILPNLFIGNDEGFEKLRYHKNWSFLRCCKFGPGGHKELLDYHTNAAPPGPNYLWVKRGPILALNIIDLDDPEMIPQELFTKGIQYIHDRLAAGDKVLVACNQGHSRSPSMVLLYLRAFDNFPDSFVTGEKDFRKMYPPYDPASGVRSHVREMWKDAPTTFGGKNAITN